MLARASCRAQAGNSMSGTKRMGEIMGSKQKTAGLSGTMNVLGAAAFILASATLSNAAVGDTIRVNSGATASFTDAAGHVWAADSGFVGGQVYSDFNAVIA